MSQISQSIENCLAIDSSGFVLLVAKLTLIIGFLLLLCWACRKYPAAFRHAILTMGLIGLPLLTALHFYAPAWSIPGAERFLKIADAEPTDVQVNGEFRLAEEPVQVERNALVQRAQPLVNPPNTAKPTNGFAIASSPDVRGLESSIEPSAAIADVENAGWATSLPAVSFGWGQFKSVVLVLWGVGFSLLVGRLVFAWFVVSRNVRRAATFDEKLHAKGVSNQVLNLFGHISDDGIQIKVASTNQSPLGIGIIRKTIMLPSNCSDWGDSHWRSVLLHEYAHFRRHDCLINLIARIQQALLWFHPLAWRYVRQILAESENACDDFVIQSGVSNVEYADVLFLVAQQSVATRHMMVATVTMSDATPLESRISSILSAHTTRNPVKPKTIAIAILGLAVIAVPVSTAQIIQSSKPVVAISKNNQDAAESSNSTIESTGEPSTTLHFFVELNNGETFVGISKEELAVESTFGKSFFATDQVRLIKPKADGKNDVKIEATDGSVVYGKIKSDSIAFDVSGKSIDVAIDQLKSASLIGRSGLLPDQISDGFAKNGVTYHVRAPKGYNASKKYPAIVLLHGSDSNAKTVVEKVATDWPAIAERYLLIGINGERESTDQSSPDPAFNYTYVNFAGLSKYKGFPGTERESPALVAEVIQEIRDYVPISTIFLGGNSDGGWLTYSMYMNFPQLIDGAFPINGAMIIQCQPDAYDDDDVRKLQRDTPIAIIHASDDKTLDRAYSTVAFERFLNDSFPMLRFLDHASGGDELGGKNFVGAILWLESMAARSELEIESSIQHLIGQARPRDAVGLLTRIDMSKLDEAKRNRFQIAAEYSEARLRAREFNRLISENQSNEWVDDFLAYREKFEFAPSAKFVMEKFNTMRKANDKTAEKLYSQARDCFEKNKNDEAYVLCEQIVTEAYASRRYSYAKKKLAQRDLADSKLP